MKKITSVALLIVLLLSVCTPAFAATGYSGMISEVLDDLESNNSRCSGAPQQAANGAYRLVDMLAIIAMEGDSGTYSNVISDVLDDLKSKNAR